MAPGVGGASGLAGSSTDGLGGGGTSGVGGRASGGAGGRQGNAGASAGQAATSPFVPGECAASPSMRVRYRQKGEAKQIIVEVELVNQSGSSIALDQLAVRYFFSDEEASGWAVSIYDAKVVSPAHDYTTKASYRLETLSVPLSGADSFIELGIDSPDVLPASAVAFLSFELQPKDYADPSQNQPNDFSFGAGHTTLTDWDRIALYVGGALAWGCLPGED